MALGIFGQLVPLPVIAFIFIWLIPMPSEIAIGVKLFHKVGAVRHALHAAKVGYDGVYAAGIEEGGHPLDDDVTTMVLTPRMKESLSIPVVAVGGIANGRNLAAALVLGADGVMMASRFMATKECEIHDNIKQELVKRQEQDTALICKSIHLQGRALRNETVECVLETEARGGGLEEIIPLISGEKCRNAWQTGDVDAAPMMVGQSIGLIHSVPTCAELLETMMAEAEERLQAVNARIING
ncbi:MAG: nitronate monooxygenase [Deltaproteobacteria bacterium]|nr:nitronate monooxygenase [Deltaproteobacteria bacterium]MBW2677008.1 nitronate monooxygenase [Deltaproteobacteria bacterium]